MNKKWPLGVSKIDSRRYRFNVWAPFINLIEVHIVAPEDSYHALQKNSEGYHVGEAECGPGTRYLYRLDGDRQLPDPASYCQPDGVHGPSQIPSFEYEWHDDQWHGIMLHNYIIYELHVGTFSQDGNFESIISAIPFFKELGITAVELMPVAQFSGDRNWGYDGVYPFAVQSSYGGALGLKKLVDALHQNGLAVILDVVYNHLGPEGNYLQSFGPYFTDKYRTPWGMAVNFDGAESDEVRRYFIENALYWIREFHIDALRLDAVHGIFDFSAYPILQELTETIHEEALLSNGLVHVIAESDLNNSRLVKSLDLGGFGMDAQWNDDFHHILHALITGERLGYYQDFGTIDQMVRAYRDGYVYSGLKSAFRGRRHGNSSREIPAERFIVFSQNHDQVGNRMLGERLSELAPPEALKLAAGLVLLSPNIPLLFMGEEYAETAGFAYFVSHSDKNLLDAVRNGRKNEFSAFEWIKEPPDPVDPATFESSKLNLNLRSEAFHKVLFDFYKQLIDLRKSHPALRHLSKDELEVFGYEKQKALFVRRWFNDNEIICVFHFGDEGVSLTLPLPVGSWEKILDSAESTWAGPGTSVPAKLYSEGELLFNLRPFQLIVCTNTGDA